ncbi:TetR/AcrR family transcriptional regulator [Magnetospirillum sp. 15-1]|uniref:TetR/AcrR family transcriptional regulator n=1 Tax=Magnetospirillum sp. 15-1 TaxID=1979370 RepID=UPI0014838FD3|nr:TetR/AcrR family transcriptional regulator [Magnetospirillum sp. 15-1]
MPKPAEKTVVRLPREDRVRDILAAAREVFCRCGFAGASIAEIASLAGVAQGTIYKFFDTKRDLVLAVLAGWYDTMLAEFNSRIPEIHGARNKLRFIVWRHIRSLVENPDLMRLCSNEVRNDGDYYHGDIYALNRKYAHVLSEVCREGMRNGEFRSDLPIPLLRDLIFGGMDHYVSSSLYQGRECDAERIADQIIDLLSTGIAVSQAGAGALEGALSRLDRLADRLDEIVERAPAGQPLKSN